MCSRVLPFLFVPLFISSAVAMLALVRSGWYQETAPEQFPAKPEVIRVTSGLVVVPVSVTDPGGNAVKDLGLEDFAVDDNGAPVKVGYLGEPEATRLDMVLSFDVTISVRSYFKFEQNAAVGFLKTVLRPGDSVAILCIDSEPKIILKRSNLLSSALNGLDQITPSGTSTAFFDTIIAGAHMLRGPVDAGTRRVQIAFSDGEDNSSEQKLSEARREVQRADCIFYSINPGGHSIHLNVISQRGQEAMEALAAQTGGLAFIASRPEDLAGLYARIVTELQAQYLLSYYSPSSKADDSFRSVMVRIPKHPEMRVRARQGYYPRGSSSH